MLEKQSPRSWLVTQCSQFGFYAYFRYWLCSTIGSKPNPICKRSQSLKTTLSRDIRTHTKISSLETDKDRVDFYITFPLWSNAISVVIVWRVLTKVSLRKNRARLYEGLFSHGNRFATRITTQTATLRTVFFLWCCWSRLVVFISFLSNGSQPSSNVASASCI